MDIEKEIKFILRQFGVKVSCIGYKYVIYGILLVLQDSTRLKHITKLLYVDIACKYDTSISCVERNIRTVVESIWNTDNKELLFEVCNSVIPHRPTNTEFFNLMYEYFVEKYFNDNYIKDQAFTKEELINEEHICSCICLQNGSFCEQLSKCYNEISKVESDKQELYKAILWIHNVTGKLLK